MKRTAKSSCTCSLDGAGSIPFFKNAFMHTLGKQIFVYSTVCIVLAVILHSAAFDLVPDILWRLCMPWVNCSKCLSKRLYISWVSLVVLGLGICAFLCVCAHMTDVCFNSNCWELSVISYLLHKLSSEDNTALNSFFFFPVTSQLLV